MAITKIPVTDGFWDGVPDGAKVRQWFRRHIELLARTHLPDVVTSTEQMELIVDYFEPMEDYSLWHTEDTCRGRGYSSGYWRINQMDVIRDLPKALASSITLFTGSLDEWLTELHSGRLEAVPAPTELSTGQMYSHQFIGDSHARLHRNFTWQRSHFWRPCRKCKTDFRPDIALPWSVARKSTTCHTCRPIAWRTCRVCTIQFYGMGRATACDSCACAEREATREQRKADRLAKRSAAKTNAGRSRG